MVSAQHQLCKASVVTSGTASREPRAADSVARAVHKLRHAGQWHAAEFRRLITMADGKPEPSKGVELFYFAAASAWLGSVAMGTNLGYSSPAIPSLKNETTGLSLTENEVSWFSSLMTLGALTGGLVAGFLVDSLGRKISIIFSSAGFILGWSLIATASTVVILCLGRVITGFFTGIISLAVPVYVSEISRPEVRGVLGAGIQLSVTIGILAVFLFGKFLNWNSLALLCMTLPAAMALLMLFMAESPRWLLQKGKRDEALKALHFLYPFADHEAEREAIETNLRMSPKESFQMKELQQPFIYKPIMISLFLMFAQQMSGINAVMFYAIKIFETAGSTIPPDDSMVIIGVVQVVATLVATMLMDKGGRRVLLLVSAALLALSLGVLGTYQYMKAMDENSVSNIGWLPLACLSIFIIGFSCGMGPIPWLMMGELLPSRVRGFATGVCTCFNWTMAFVVTKTFNDMIRILNVHGVYWFFCSVMVLSFIAVVVTVPETKGKTLEEIEQAFRGVAAAKPSGDAEAARPPPPQPAAPSQASTQPSTHSTVPSSVPQAAPAAPAAPQPPPPPPPMPPSVQPPSRQSLSQPQSHRASIQQPMPSAQAIPASQSPRRQTSSHSLSHPTPGQSQQPQTPPRPPHGGSSQPTAPASPARSSSSVDRLKHKGTTSPGYGAQETSGIVLHDPAPLSPGDDDENALPK